MGACMRTAIATAIVLSVVVPRVYAVTPATKQVCTVGVDLQGNDGLGRRVAVALKERINSSSLYRLGDTTNSLFLVQIGSAPITLDEGQLGSAFAVAYIYLADSCSRNVMGKQRELEYDRASKPQRTHVLLSMTTGWWNAGKISIPSEAEVIFSRLDEAVSPLRAGCKP